jgi:hypothetical protein
VGDEALGTLICSRFFMILQLCVFMHRIHLHKDTKDSKYSPCSLESAQFCQASSTDVDPVFGLL